MKKNLLVIVALLLSFSLFAQETVEVKSPSMGRNIKNNIYTPEDYSTNKSYPVLYLLNGYSGDHTAWGTIKKSLRSEATKYNMIIVCPDGQDSWYWDSPIDKSMQFETYITKELLPYIDQNYKTRANAKGRAISGLSMGGQGGLWLGINYPNLFGACGSMSGGVDIRPFPNNWKIKERLGKYSENKEIWDSFTIVNQLHKIEPNTLKIIVDCGYDDFFHKVNEELHQRMLYMNIEHDYIVRPGGHDFKYWSNAIDYQLLFFSKFFN